MLDLLLLGVSGMAIQKRNDFLIKKYGENSLEHNKFHKMRFSPLAWYGIDMEEENRNAISWCCDNLRSCKAVFETYLEDMKRRQR